MSSAAPTQVGEAGDRGSFVHIVTLTPSPSKQGSSKLTLEKDSLNKILERVGDRPVHLLSIAGANDKENKAPLVNVAVNALEKLSNNGDVDHVSFEVLDRKPSKPEKQLDAGTEAGLWMWSKPFILTKADGTELVVLLMNSRGVFEEYTSKWEWSCIVALSLLTSSALIYNLFNKIEEDNLDMFHHFLEVAALAQAKDNQFPASFQKLIFLIQDWNCPHQAYHSGLNGGKKYLEEKLTIKSNTHKDHQGVRRNLQSSFKEIECVLLPRGVDSFPDNNLDRPFQSKSLEHLRNVKAFTEDILIVDNIKPKHIKGQAVHGVTLLQLFEKCIEALNGQTLPKTTSISEAITDATLESLSSDCLRKYSGQMNKIFQDVDFMSSTDLKDVNENYFKEAMDGFCKGSNVTDRSQLIKHCLYLANELRMLFTSFVKNNELEKTSFLQTIFSEAMTDYRCRIEANRMTMLKDELNTFLSGCKIKTISEMSSKCGNRDPAFFSGALLPQMTSHLKDMDEQYILANDAKLRRIESEYKEEISKLAEEYDEQMQLHVGNDDSVSETKVQRTHKSCEGKAVKEFRKFIPLDNPRIAENATCELKYEIAKLAKVYIERATTSVKEAQKTAWNKAMSIVDEAFNCYSTTMDGFENTYKGDNLKLGLCELHTIQQLNAYTKLAPIYRYCDDNEIERLKKQLNDQMNSVYTKILHHLENKETDLERKWNNAVKSASESYNRLLRKQLAGPILISEEDVKIKHFEIVSIILSDAKAQEWPNNKKFKDAVNKSVEPILIQMLASHQKDIEQVEMDAQLAINSQITTFGSELQTHIVNESFLDFHQLQESFKTYEKIAVETLDKITYRLPQNNSNSLLSNLQEGLNTSFQDIRAEFGLQLDKKRTTVSKLISEAVAVYNSCMDMQQNLLPFPDDDQIKRMHDHCKFIADRQLDENVKPIVGALGISEIKTTFDDEISEEFRRRNEEFKAKEIALQHQMEQLRKTTLEMYEKDFKSRMECAAGEEDLRSIHNNLRVSSLEKFQGQFPTKDLNKMLPEQQLLEKQLQQSYDRLVNEFRNWTSTIDQATKMKIKEIVDEYNSRMEAYIYAYAYLPEDQISSSHNQSVKRGLAKLKASNKPASVDPKEYDDILIHQLEDRLQFYLSENTLRRSVLEQKILQKVGQLKTEFLSELTPYVLNDAFENLSVQCRDTWKVTLLEPYNLPNADTLQDFCKQAIDDALKEAHSYWLSIEPPDDNLELAMRRSMESYQIGMDRYTADKKFLYPGVLAEYQRRMTVEVEKTFQESVKQTESAKQRLADALNRAFQKYNDENDTKMADLVDVAIGIDLGTTCCCVSIYRKGGFEMIPDLYDHLNITPSYVCFQNMGNILVGELAKEEAETYPEKTIYDVKRLIGRKFNDPKTQQDIEKWPFTVYNDDGSPMIQIRHEAVENKKGGGVGKPGIQIETYSPEEVQAQILARLKKNAESYLGCKVENAVITVPAYFNEAQKVATKNAGSVAGLNVLGILNEPTAAAMAHSSNYTHDQPKNLLVYDFGGGTFDVSVLTITSGVQFVDLENLDIETRDSSQELSKDNHNVVTKAVGGDDHLGGANIDNNIMDYSFEIFEKNTGIDLRTVGTKHEINTIRRRIRHAGEKAKKKLSDSTSAEVKLKRVYGDLDMDVEITRQVFDEINGSLFQQTVETVRVVLEEANLQKSDIHEVLLVGGSTRIPRVQQLLQEFFNGKKLTMAANPDEIVARGAAMFAAIKSGSTASKALEHIKFSDVTPLPIGVEIKGGKFDVIIPKNTLIPTTRSETYSTVYDYQREVTISVYEGTKSIAVNNNLMGSFNLQGIPPNRKGKEEVDVIITIDREGILHVKAVCKSNGKDNDIKIESKRSGLTDEEIKTAQQRIKVFQETSKASHDSNPNGTTGGVFSTIGNVIKSVVTGGKNPDD